MSESGVSVTLVKSPWGNKALESEQSIRVIGGPAGMYQRVIVDLDKGAGCAGMVNIPEVAPNGEKRIVESAGSVGDGDVLHVDGVDYVVGVADGGDVTMTRQFKDHV